MKSCIGAIMGRDIPTHHALCSSSLNHRLVACAKSKTGRRECSGDSPTAAGREVVHAVQLVDAKAWKRALTVSCSDGNPPHTE